MEQERIMKVEDLTLDVVQTVEIKATPEKVFAAVLHRFGKGNTRPDGQSMQMLLEPRAGGRWYRDRGNGVEHLWGFVQVMKAPTLLELSGPMFMSYPAMNHVEIKVEPMAGGCKLHLRHRALGMIDPEHRKGVGEGWSYTARLIKQDSEQA
jgi:hypothetical protein